MAKLTRSREEEEKALEEAILGSYKKTHQDVFRRNGPLPKLSSPKSLAGCGRSDWAPNRSDRPCPGLDQPSHRPV
uniref:Uncharacterized protein n=1 Tax=Oryza sativa subsp. japonica TaxID=39947 RepID=Q69XR8_ORYSJ|nr:hypothetical protein [Oryza sativa Japonica Group]